MLGLASLSILLIACATVAESPNGSGGSSAIDRESEDYQLRVISTVSPITSIVENIGGSRIRLQGIIPEGVNSHTFEPAPSIARAMAEVGSGH